MRALSVLLLIVMSAVHLNLYVREDYSRIPTIGMLFLLTAISGVLLAIGAFTKPGRLVYLSTGLFALGVLGGYVLTLTLPDGLFSFKEPGISYSGFISIVAETALLAISILAFARGPVQHRTSGSFVTAA